MSRKSISGSIFCTAAAMLVILACTTESNSDHHEAGAKPGGSVVDADPPIPSQPTGGAQPATPVPVTPVKEVPQTQRICERTITADVVALDQPFMWNRLGAANPSGMVFALKRDVVPTDYNPASSPPGELKAGQVRLRDDKRARPMVLRAGQGDCLQITFTNLLNDKAPPSTSSSETRYASVHVVGLELVGSIASDGTWVGKNKSSLAKPGETKVYTLYAKDEGTFLLYSGADANGTQAQNGFFGAVNVQPQRAEFYRSQVTAVDLKQACLTALEAAEEEGLKHGIIVPNNPKIKLTKTEEEDVYQLTAQADYRAIAGSTKVTVDMEAGGCIQAATGHNLIDYYAVYPEGAQYPSGQPIPTGTPVLSMIQVKKHTAIYGQPLKNITQYRKEIEELERGFIPKELKGVFKQAGIELTEYATVTRNGGYQVIILDLGQAYLVELLGGNSDGYSLVVSLASFELIHTDLTAIVTGPNATRFPYSQNSPSFRENPASPDRRQPYREYTIIYHQANSPVQAFAQFFGTNNTNVTKAFQAGDDGFAINYGTGGIGAEILANRIGVGPMGNADAVDLAYEEFFLSAWAVGDPAMIVDVPANANAQTISNPSQGSQNIPTDKQGQFEFPNPHKANKAFFPDDPSNVYHSYMRDHVKFRILHAGRGPAHVHHLHAHQWLHSPNSDNGHYLDSQLIIPGASYTLEIAYNGSGNRNQTVGDSIFHCHFYPHFAQGMWSMWRVHDVFESGTEVGAEGIPLQNARALPDGEIQRGTPIPAIVPLPSLAMAPLPGPVQLTNIPGIDDSQGRRVEVLPITTKDGKKTYKNPGYPFFIPGVAGHRAPHPPLDFAWKEENGQPTCKDGKEYPCEKEFLDGGLPRHVVLGGELTKEFHTRWDFTKDYVLYNEEAGHDKSLQTEANMIAGGLTALQLPENGTRAERVAMETHATRTHFSVQPDGEPGNFILNGLPPVPGAPYAAPDVDDDGDAVSTSRRYQAAVIQTDVVLNKKGWHYPQQRFLTLWGDIAATTSGERPPQPFFFRSNTGDSIEFWHTDLVPVYYELDDFQVRTPTDVIGQHIHLVKFDVTSSDGAANGFNYEDGTFSPDEVRDRINAINRSNGIYQFDAQTQFQGTTQEKLTIKPYQDWYPETFGEAPANQNWDGAQTTIQRWDTDPLLNNEGEDRTLRTVFTHDHMSPSTHQQVGLYAGLVVEPENSEWFLPDGMPMYTRDDGGPTSWHGYVVTANPDDSYREFMLEFQDMQLSYANQSRTSVSNTAFDPRNEKTELFQNFLFNTAQFGQAASTQAYIDILNAKIIPKPLRTLFVDQGATLPCPPPPPGEENKEENQCVEVIEPSKQWLIKRGSQRPEYYIKATAFTTVSGTEGVGITGVKGHTGISGITVPMTLSVYTPVAAALFNTAQLGKESSTQAYIDILNASTIPNDFPSLFAKVGIPLSNNASVAPVAGKNDEWLIQEPEPSAGGTVNAGTEYVVRATNLISPVEGVTTPSALSVYTPDIDPGWADPQWALNPHVDRSNGGIPTCDGVGELTTPTCSFGNGGPYPQLISFQAINFGTYSMNYRNEPLQLRVTSPTGETPSDPKQTDMSYVFNSLPNRLDPDQREQPTPGASIDDPNKSVVNCGTLSGELEKLSVSQPFPGTPGNRQSVQPGPAPEPLFPCQALSPGMQPGDPYTPLLRAYANDKIQVRTLVGAHLQPHSFQIQGVKWNFEPSDTDSGYRNVQGMGLSEHFEMLFTLPPAAPKSDKLDKPFADYLYSASSGITGLTNGLWGIMRAYDTSVDDLAPLPKNSNPDSVQLDFQKLYEQAVADGKPHKEFSITATTAAQAITGGKLVYNNASGGFSDPDAVIFFPTGTSLPLDPKDVTPLILRAAAGDWIKVTLKNDFNPASAPFKRQYALNFGSPFGKGTLAADGTTVHATIPSLLLNMSPQVALHPQLVAYDVTQANGVNVGFNPDQTVGVNNTKTFYWYAGDISVKEKCQPGPCQSYIQQTPIEFGATNLVSSDLMVQPQYGLIGALIIEPEGSSWDETKQYEDSIDIKPGDEKEPAFREFVAINQNMIAQRLLGAINYRNDPYVATPPPAACTGTNTPAGCNDCTGPNPPPACNIGFGSGFANPTPNTPTFEAPAGMPVRFRMLMPSTSAGNSASGPYALTIDGHAWQEEPYIDNSTKIGDNPLSQVFGSQQMVPYTAFNFVLPSAGGTCRIPGDYLYNTYQQSATLGTWGIFRVAPGKEGINPLCQEQHVAEAPKAPEAPASGNDG